MEETQAEADRTIVLIRQVPISESPVCQRLNVSAGFDACEHEHQAMQRHDRRVPVSFFSRYTRDIVSFANKYTEGKIVSVLEGGYSDRALTSAAMGHIVGLLDKGGQPHWWSETELNNVSFLHALHR
jgi:histone deacetylase HOS3